MIILPQRDSKFDSSTGPVLRHPERLFVRSSSPLPDYDTSEAQHRLLNKPSPGRFDSRFWRAVLAALAIYVLLSAVIGVPLIVLKTRNKPSSDDDYWPDGPSNALWAANGLNLSIPYPDSLSPGGNVTCNIWNISETSSWPHYFAETQYKLLSPGLITIRSNVSFDAEGFGGVNGTLLVDVNQDEKIEDTIIQLQLNSSTEILRRNTKVCFSDAGDKKGLSIYVPQNLSQSDFLFFNIHVLLPRKPTPLTSQSLITSLPMFSQKFGDLRKYTNLNQVNIEGSYQGIFCKYLQASQISIKNLIAPIEGNFNVTDSLSLDTVKGAINANITLVQTMLSTKPTQLNLDTGYSAINSRVTLLAPSSQRKAATTPLYLATVKTFDSPIDLKIFHAENTPPVPLKLTVQNNLAATNISLDSKFQGSFSAQSKLASVIIFEGVENPRFDPTGRNLSRTLEYDQKSFSQASGWIGWGSRPSGLPSILGYVEIVSSLGPVLLALGSRHL